MHGKKKGSGVAMYVRNMFNFVIDKEMSILTGDIEALFIKINNGSSSIIVGTVYCPPSGNQKKNFWSQWQTFHLILIRKKII